MEYGSGSSLGMVMVLMVASGCGDDGGPGGSGNGTDTDDSTGTTQVTTNDETATTTLNTDSAEGGSESSGAPGSSEGGAQEVMLGGSTQDFVGPEPIPGSEIRIFGMDAITSTADDQGSFELGPLPSDTPVSLVLEPISVDTVDYVGAIVPERTGTEDRSDAVAWQIQRGLIESQLMAIENQMPQMPDLEQAIVVVRLASGAPLADGAVTIEMEPPPEAGTFYAPDAKGRPVLDSGAIEFQLIPAAVFFNLPDTQPGEITITAEHDNPLQWTCTVNHPEWPTLGAYTTIVEVTCAQ